MSNTAPRRHTSINRPLLLETLARIEAHPETWNQANWSVAFPNSEWRPDKVCNTRFCFAGHVMVAEGFVPWFDQERLQSEIEKPDLYGNGLSTSEFVPLAVAKAAYKAFKKGEYFNVAETDLHDVECSARDLLGLTENQADALFDGSNDIHELRGLIFEYILVDDIEQAEELKCERVDN